MDFFFFATVRSLQPDLHDFRVNASRVRDALSVRVLTFLSGGWSPAQTMGPGH